MNSRGFGERFRAFLAQRWLARFAVLGVSLLVGWGIDLLFQNTPLLQGANLNVYTVIQKRLGQMEKQTERLILIDLSSVLWLRRDEPITPGEVQPSGEVAPSRSQEEFRLQIVGLTELLEIIGSFKPRAIFVDWQVTIPRALWDAEKGDWASGVSEQFKQDYERFLDTMERLGTQGCEVFIEGSLVADLYAAGLPTAPGRRRDRLLLESTLPRIGWGSYYPLAVMRKGSLYQLPAVTDGLIDALRKDEAARPIEDLIAKAPVKWGVFHATVTVGDQECFWIDYGYAVPLVREALYLDLVRYRAAESQAMLAEKLAGKIVFLVDLTKPEGEDSITVPVSPTHPSNLRSDGSSYAITDERRSGGLAQACAFLTRTQAPLYALSDGWTATFFFISVNVGIALLAWLLSGLFVSLLRTNLDTPLEAAAELVALILVTVLVLLYGIELMARARIMIPQIEGYLVTRIVDTLLLPIVLLIHIRKTTRNAQGAQHQQESQGVS